MIYLFTFSKKNSLDSSLAQEFEINSVTFLLAFDELSEAIKPKAIPRTDKIRENVHNKISAKSILLLL